MDRTSQELMVDTLNGEMNRYWARFNIFVAIQIGAVVGGMNILNVLLANPVIFRFVFIFLLWFSITGVIAVLRGHDLQRSIVLALEGIEQSLPEDQRLLALTRRHFRMPTFLGNYICSIFAIFCCVAWVSAWIWMEIKGYCGIVIPKL